MRGFTAQCSRKASTWGFFATLGIIRSRSCTGAMLVTITRYTCLPEHMNNNSHNSNSCGNTNMIIIIMGNTDINDDSDSNYNDSINNNDT